MSWLRGVLSTIAGICAAAFLLAMAGKHRRREVEHAEAEQAARRDHELTKVRAHQRAADNHRKQAADLKARAQERINDAAERHDTPDLDDVVSRYNSRVRERAGKGKPVA